MNVPVAAIKQAILDWIAQHEKLHPKVKSDRSSDVALEGSSALAFASGLSVRTLYRVLNESEEVQEATAEKILITGMARPDLWLTCVEPHLQPPSHRRRWTDEENELVMSGLPDKVIAEKIGVSIVALKTRRRRLRHDQKKERLAATRLSSIGH